MLPLHEEEAGKLEEGQLYRMISENSIAGVAVAQEGKIIYANAAYCEMFGYRPNELLGKSMLAVVAPEDQPLIHERAAQRVRGQEVPDRYTFKGMRKDGARLDIEVSSSQAVCLGEKMTILSTFLDVSDRQRAEAALEQRNLELQQANEELKKLHRSKDEFISIISHELRTPLVTGLGYIEMLLDGAYGPISPTIASRMKTARKNLKRLSSLIEDLLQYRSIIQDQDKPRLAPLDLASLAAEAVAELQVRTGREPDRVRLEAEGEIPPVLADAEMIRRALDNLLNNAANHAGEGALIRLVLKRAPGQRICTSIIDDGVGMPTEIRTKAFTPFARPERTSSGSGLGLAIVHAILEAHHSELILASEAGQGTSASFLLPVLPEASLR
jgi:PAS domain S-box-containing protein